MSIGKYILIIVGALIILFGLDYFKIVDVPGIGVPFTVEDKGEYGKEKHKAVKEALGEDEQKKRSY